MDSIGRRNANAKYREIAAHGDGLPGSRGLCPQPRGPRGPPPPQLPPTSTDIVRMINKKKDSVPQPSSTKWGRSEVKCKASPFGHTSSAVCFSQDTLYLRVLMLHHRADQNLCGTINLDTSRADHLLPHSFTTPTATAQPQSQSKSSAVQPQVMGLFPSSTPVRGSTSRRRDINDINISGSLNGNANFEAQDFQDSIGSQSQIEKETYLGRQVQGSPQPFFGAQQPHSSASTHGVENDGEYSSDELEDNDGDYVPAESHGRSGSRQASSDPSIELLTQMAHRSRAPTATETSFQDSNFETSIEEVKPYSSFKVKAPRTKAKPRVIQKDLSPDENHWVSILFKDSLRELFVRGNFWLDTSELKSRAKAQSAARGVEWNEQWRDPFISKHSSFMSGIGKKAVVEVANHFDLNYKTGPSRSTLLFLDEAKVKAKSIINESSYMWTPGKTDDERDPSDFLANPIVYKVASLIFSHANQQPGDAINLPTDFSNYEETDEDEQQIGVNLLAFACAAIRHGLDEASGNKLQFSGPAYSEEVLTVREFLGNGDASLELEPAELGLIFENLSTAIEERLAIRRKKRRVEGEDGPSASIVAASAKYKRRRVATSQGISFGSDGSYTGNFGVSPRDLLSSVSVVLEPVTGRDYYTFDQVDGFVYGPDSLSDRAAADLQSAYTFGIAQTPTVPTDSLHPELAGQIFKRGVYRFTSLVSIAAGGTLELNGAAGDVFIFQCDSISIGVKTQVVLSGGVAPTTVFWLFGGHLVIDEAADFSGQAFGSSITVGSYTQWSGAAYSLGTVALGDGVEMANKYASCAKGGGLGATRPSSSSSSPSFPSSSSPPSPSLSSAQDSSRGGYTKSPLNAKKNPRKLTFKEFWLKIGSALGFVEDEIAATLSRTFTVDASFSRGLVRKDN
ncbi:hypothetical protein P7C70_g810, partial [Phenoliferia sp. Uapishka_3]